MQSGADTEVFKVKEDLRYELELSVIEIECNFLLKTWILGRSLLQK